jgi:hypothetical protein
MCHDNEWFIKNDCSSTLVLSLPLWKILTSLQNRYYKIKRNGKVTASYPCEKHTYMVGYLVKKLKLKKLNIRLAGLCQS